MKNIKITIEYEGTNYAGWQVQKNALSVQEVLEKSIEQITGNKAKLFGAGRTDSGVHALGQTANFFLSSNILTKRIPKALNSCLPKDIRIIEAEQVDDSFHSRYSAKEKTYRYQIMNNQFGSALYNKYFWHVKESLDLDNIEKAAALLKGTYDFSSFKSTGSNTESSIRTIKDITVKYSGSSIIIEITADGFLYNMVRIITGTLIQLFGIKGQEPEYLNKIISSKDRNMAGITAPPQGLFLLHVFY